MRGAAWGAAPNAFFGNFGPRGDAEVGLFWELQSLGFTDVAIMRQPGGRARDPEPGEDPDPDPGRCRRRRVLRDPPGGRPPDRGRPRNARRGHRIAQAQFRQHPPGRRSCPARLAPSRSCSRSRRSPRAASITSTRSCPTTAPSSSSSGPSARRRDGPGTTAPGPSGPGLRPRVTRIRRSGRMTEGRRGDSRCVTGGRAR